MGGPLCESSTDEPQSCGCNRTAVVRAVLSASAVTAKSHVDRHHFRQLSPEHCNVSFSARSCACAGWPSTKTRKIAFLIFYEVIEIFLVDLSVF